MPDEVRHDSGLRGFRDGTPGIGGYSSLLSNDGQAVPRASVFYQPGVNGYGETYGNYAQAREDAAERDRQDISDLRNTVGLMNDIRAYSQASALDPLALQDAQEKLATAKMVRQEAEMKIQDLMARRKRREAVVDSAEFMGLKEALDNGVVAQDTLDEMNAVRQEAGLPFVSAMGYDPETGKIMVFDEEGNPYEYDRVGTLETFFDAFPEYDSVASNALPTDVAQQRSARMQALLQAQKMSQEEERYRQKQLSDYASALVGANQREIERLMGMRKALMENSPVEGDPEYEQIKTIDERIKALDKDNATLLNPYRQSLGLTQVVDSDEGLVPMPQVSVAQPQGGPAVDWRQLKASGQK